MLPVYYQSIQLIMAHLGYYSGDFDGIWGPACVEAKRKWELDDEFEPAAPNGGLPFRVNGKLPKGLHWDVRRKGTIICTGLTKERREELLASRKGIVTAEDIAKSQKNENTTVHDLNHRDLGLLHGPEDPGMNHVHPKPEPSVVEVPIVEEAPVTQTEVPDYLKELDTASEVADTETDETYQEDVVQEESIRQDWTTKKKRK